MFVIGLIVICHVLVPEFSGGVFGKVSRPKNWFPLTIEPCAVVELWFPHVFVLFFCVIGFHHLFVGTNLFAKYGNQTTKAKNI